MNVRIEKHYGGWMVINHMTNEWVDEVLHPTLPEAFAAVGMEWIVEKVSL